MQAKEPAQPIRIEPRWPVVLSVLVVLFVLTMLPARIRLLPSWFAYAIGIALLLPMARRADDYARLLRVC
jgi:hypothetical protein